MEGEGVWGRVEGRFEAPLSGHLKLLFTGLVCFQNHFTK